VWADSIAPVDDLQEGVDRGVTVARGAGFMVDDWLEISAL
jgi:hypothetical protein